MHLDSPPWPRRGLVPWQLTTKPLEEEHVNVVDKLWIALGKAIRSGASEKQINGIAARLNNLRRNV